MGVVVGLQQSRPWPCFGDFCESPMYLGSCRSRTLSFAALCIGSFLNESLMGVVGCAQAVYHAHYSGYISALHGTETARFGGEQRVGTSFDHTCEADTVCRAHSPIEKSGCYSRLPSVSLAGSFLLVGAWCMRATVIHTTRLRFGGMVRVVGGFSEMLERILCSLGQYVQVIG